MNCVYLQPSTATGTSAGVVLTPAGVAVDTTQQGPRNMPPMSFLGSSGAAADAVASAVLLACELQNSECLTTTSGHGDNALPAFIEHAPGFPVGALSAALHRRARAMKPCVGGEQRRNAGDVASHPSAGPSVVRSANDDRNDLRELTVALERLEVKVTEEKTSGAAHFKDGDHAAALRCYQRALKALEPAVTHLNLLRRDGDGTDGTSSVAQDGVADQGDDRAYEAPIRRLAWALQLNACVCCYMIGAPTATKGNVAVATAGSAAEASLLRCERFGKRVLDAMPSHPKVLLFLAKASSARGEFDACVAWCDTLLALQQHGAIDELGLEQYPGALSTDEFASVLHQAAPAVSTLRAAAAQRLTAEKTQQRQAMQRMFAS